MPWPYRLTGKSDRRTLGITRQGHFPGRAPHSEQMLRQDPALEKEPRFPGTSHHWNQLWEGDVYKHETQ